MMRENKPLFTNITQFSERELDKFVESHPYGNIFQTYSMWNVFKEVRGYDPIDVIATDGSGEIRGVLIGYLTKYPLGISRAVAYGGPLVTDSTLVRMMLEEFEKKAISQSKFLLFADIRNMWDTNNYKHEFLGSGYNYEDHLNYIIPLRGDLREIWYTIPRNRRKNIKRGLSKFRVEDVKDRRDVETVYNLILNTYKKTRVPAPSSELIEKAFLYLIKKNYLKIFLAYSKDTGIPVATRLLLLFKDRVYDWYAGSLYTKEAQYSNETLVWKAIEYGASNNFKVFDFGGAGHPKKEYGPREFKRRFNGIEVNWGIYRKIFRAKSFRLIIKLASIKYSGIKQQM